VIVSVRDIELRNESAGSVATGETVAGNQNETQLKSTKSHELTIRLADGSSRVINEASPAHWRLGERVIVIDGALPSDQ
jgi:outer membrane lipoprotein SlyB